MLRRLVLIGAALGVIACAPVNVPLEESGMEGTAEEAGMPVLPGTEGAPAGEVEEMIVSQEDAGREMEERGAYLPYHADVIGNGEMSVLYFKADWCPKCRAQHAELSASYDYPLTTYYLDYDAEKELRARYGVVTQHTFVKINGDGNLLASTSFPSPQAFAQFLDK